MMRIASVALSGWSAPSTLPATAASLNAPDAFQAQVRRATFYRIQVSLEAVTRAFARAQSDPARLCADLGRITPICLPKRPPA